MLLEKGHLEEAGKEINRAIRMDAGQPQFYQLRAKVRERGQDLIAAKADLYKAIALAPDSLEAYMGLISFMADRTSMAAEAMRVVEKAMARFPESAQLYYSRGHLKDIRRDEAGARRDYERAIDLDPSVPFFHGRLAALLANDPAGAPTAIAHLEKAAELAPEEPEWRYELGALLIREKKWLEARVALERAAELRPSDRAVYWALSRVYRALGLTEKAAQALERTARLARAAEMPKPEFLRALKLEEEGKAKDAEEAYQRLATSYQAAEVYYSLARLYSNTGQPAKAESAIRAALDTEPRNPEYLLLLALTLVDLDRWDDAEQATRSAIRSKPNDSGLRNLLGDLLITIGKTDDAVQSYREAVDLAPRTPDYRMNLANALKRKGDIPAAESELAVYRDLTRPH
jgi:tetratricopeptide (TPR) repeat protein